MLAVLLIIAVAYGAYYLLCRGRSDDGAAGRPGRSGLRAWPPAPLPSWCHRKAAASAPGGPSALAAPPASGCGLCGRAQIRRPEHQFRITLLAHRPAQLVVKAMASSSSTGCFSLEMPISCRTGPAGPSRPMIPALLKLSSTAVPWAILAGTEAAAEALSLEPQDLVDPHARIVDERMSIRPYRDIVRRKGPQNPRRGR